MIVRLLPSHATDSRLTQQGTCFLIDGCLAIDAGSLDVNWGRRELAGLRDVFLTHSHLDHVGGLPMWLTEQWNDLDETITVHGTAETLAAVHTHLFNGVIWPDYSKIPLPSRRAPTLRWSPVEPECSVAVGKLRVTAVPTLHTVPSVGLLVEDESCAVLFSSDTYATESLWCKGRESPKLAAVYVEVSYPNAEARLASRARHLTPLLLEAELAKLNRPEVPIRAVHLKPRFQAVIRREIESLGLPALEVATIDTDHHW